MNIRELIDILKCSPEGQSSPKIVAVLEALADELEKSTPAPVAVDAAKKKTAKKN